jgi:hypothetical protein
MAMEPTPKRCRIEAPTAAELLPNPKDGGLFGCKDE